MKSEGGRRMRGLEVGRNREAGPGKKWTVCWRINEVEERNDCCLLWRTESGSVWQNSPKHLSIYCVTSQSIHKGSLMICGVLLLWSVWGSALEWPAHLSGPRAQAEAGKSDHTPCTVVMLNLWNVSQASGWVSTSSALLRPETVWHNTPRAVSTWQHGRSERGRGREGRTNLEWALTEMLFHVEVFMNERKVSLALCFSRRTLFGVDMFDFS